MTSPLDSIARGNPEYVDALYRSWQADPASVPADWGLFFAGFEFAGQPAQVPQGQASKAAEPTRAGVFGLVTAYREFGHLVARLDPLSEPPATHPLLELGNFGLSPADLDRDVDPRPFRGDFHGSLRELIAALRETYAGTIGVEYTDIPDKQRRDWLEERIERGRNRPRLDPEDRVRLVERLLGADALEQFLHVKYVGQKRFSLEGGGALVPMLDTLVEAAGALGVEQLVLGMPHRGRINVLANVFGKPLERVFGEFESSFAPADTQDQGDVKYHLGFSSRRELAGGRTIGLHMHFNPSHLEFVNPVVLGSVRARQTFMGDVERMRCWPVLLHGEAAFVGEGIVAETLTLAQLPAYQVGGTIHVVVNNQVGFTTSPEEGRPTRYPTDIARVVEAPVFHVNGDDPEAVVHVMRLAVDYRARFRRDVFIDFVCYRRHGHNELDDASFTQPVMTRAIQAHVPASRAYAERLVREGVLDAAGLQAIESEIAQRLNAGFKQARTPAPPAQHRELTGAWAGLTWGGTDAAGETAVSRATLEQIARAAAAVPAELAPHPKVAKLLAERIAMVAEDRIDWGCAEVLAFGSLLLEGYPVRLSGQDTARGTFSHRHAVLHDMNTGATYVPLQHLQPGQGRFEVINSMLSEAAVLGYEYGYSTTDPHTLVAWEAQFGDFANVAQVAIDQFLASSETKWSRMSGLVLLLPHGYEGQGPEHSSARLERFLELCAKGNMQVCNLTTPANLFHALRRQLHRTFRKPLVIMSPKSLLRHRLAVSPARAFSAEGFRSVIDDAAIADPDAARVVLATSGRFAYVLEEARAAAVQDGAPAGGGRAAFPIVRLEQLYPFPRTELIETLARYPKARELRWVQEEPANMGAWRHIRHRLEGVLPRGVRLCMIARKAVPAPATGYYPMHADEERLLVERAFRRGSAESVHQVESETSLDASIAPERPAMSPATVDVTVPRLSETITEAVVAQWLKPDGAPVRGDEPVVTLETDKAAVEIAAPQSGVLRHARPEGARVVVGDVLAHIEPGGDGAGAPAPPAAPPAASASAAAPSAPASAASGAAAPQAKPAEASRAGAPTGPAARRLLDEAGMGAGDVRGSGRGGRVLKEDVARAATPEPSAASSGSKAPPAAPAPAAPAARAAAAPSPAPSGKGERVVPMTRIRQRIAERLVQAQHTAAILTTFNEIDMTAVLAARARHKDTFEQRHGVRLGFMSFFGRAAIQALAEIPELNAEIRGTDVVYRDAVHLGVAVGTDRGLIVPVVRNAESLGFAAIEREIARLAGRARENTLSLDELSGGTFTISNGGVYGSLLSTPILNPPQSGILGMHKIEKRPVVVNDQIVVRPMMYVALSYDHRLVDGEQAVTFLVRVKERLEDPERMLLDV